MKHFLHLSVNAYRAILRLYPNELRRDFGPDMLEAFSDDLTAQYAARGVRGAMRVWRIALRESIRIGYPAWVQIPAVAVPALSVATVIVTQSPLLIMTMRRGVPLRFHPGAADPIDALIALAIESAITALTSFVAVYRWKRASYISLGLG
jgi:hypothetical protein